MAAFVVPFGAFAAPCFVAGLAFAAPFVAVAVAACSFAGLALAAPSAEAAAAACSSEDHPLLVPFVVFAEACFLVVDPFEAVPAAC